MSKPLLVELPRFIDPRGSLSIIEELSHTPFKIARCHLIYNVLERSKECRYACTSNQELIVPLSGSFNVIVDDGIEQSAYNLNKPYLGLFIPEGMWREFVDFSTDAVVLVLSSKEYNADDYLVKYDDFKRKKNG